MSRAKRWGLRSLILGVLLVLTVIGVILVGREVAATQDSYRVEFSFKEPGSDYEIRVSEKDKGTYLYENGKQKKIITMVPRESLPLFNLPTSNTVLDIPKELKPTSPLTWKATPKQSASYINFLKKQGYTVLREVHTWQFVEYVLSKDDSRLRVLVFQASLMSGELQKGAALPDLEEYLKNYNF